MVSTFKKRDWNSTNDPYLNNHITMQFEAFNSIARKPRIVPTNDEKSFLNHRLVLLDPKNSGKIGANIARQFLNMGRLSGTQMREIWAICNPNKLDQLSYEDMMVAFRLVSYAQNGIQISKQNLELNLKCELPRFADEQDQQPPVKQSQPQQQKGLLQQPQYVQFDKLWVTLEKKRGLINGNDVKNLYQTAANKSSLSSAWRLCSHTQRGYLSKGQLFIFVQLIKMLKEQLPLPAQLTPEMKQIINLIDSQENRGSLPNDSKGPQILPALNLPKQKMQKIEEKMKRSKESADLHYEEENVALNKFLSDVDNYILQVEANNSKYQKQIQILKGQNSEMSSRLHSNIMRLKGIIQKQNMFIEDLIGQLSAKNQIQSTRVKTLEGVQDRKYEKPKPPEKENPISKKSIESQESGIQQKVAKKPEVVQSQQKIQKKTEQPAQIPQQTQQKSPVVASTQQQQPVEQESAITQNLIPYMQQTFQLLQMVRTLDPQQLQLAKERIFAMNLEQLQNFYAQLIALYQQNVQANTVPQSQRRMSEYASNIEQPKMESQKSIPPQQESSPHQESSSIIQPITAVSADKPAQMHSPSEFDNVDFNFDFKQKPSDNNEVDFFA